MYVVRFFVGLHFDTEDFSIVLLLVPDNFMLKDKQDFAGALFAYIFNFSLIEYADIFAFRIDVLALFNVMKRSSLCNRSPTHIAGSYYGLAHSHSSLSQS